MTTRVIAATSAITCGRSGGLRLTITVRSAAGMKVGTRTTVVTHAVSGSASTTTGDGAGIWTGAIANGGTVPAGGTPGIGGAVVPGPVDGDSATMLPRTGRSNDGITERRRRS